MSNQEKSKTAKQYCAYRIQVRFPNRVFVEKRDANDHVIEEPEGILRFDGPEATQIETLVELAQAGSLLDHQPRELGEALFNVLFDDGLRPNFVTFYNETVHQKN